MALIPLGKGDWTSEEKNLPHSKMRNMYLSDNPFSQDGITRFTRPSLTLFYDFSSTKAVYGIWKQEGVLNDDWLVVVGEKIYTLTNDASTLTEIGDLPGTSFVQFADRVGRVLILRDGIVYSTDGTSLTTVNMPDGNLVSSIASINNYFLLSVKDEQQYYWIEPGQTDPDPLSFASAERSPDDIVSITIRGDEVWFIGQTTTEVHAPTGQADNPFQRITGRVYNIGCKDEQTVTPVTYEGSPALCWVSDTNSVIISIGQPETISTEMEEELIKNSNNLRAWFFENNRNSFYVLTADEFTLVFDMDKKAWYRWDSYGRDNWRAHLGIQTSTGVYGIDNVRGYLWKLENNGFDHLSDPITREISGFIPNTSKRQPCYSVFAAVNSGWSPEYNKEPILQLRWSDDYGQTWSDYMDASLGDKGEYNTDVYYRSLGLIQSPGRIFEFRFSSLATFRIDHAVLNEE